MSAPGEKITDVVPPSNDAPPAPAGSAAPAGDEGNLGSTPPAEGGEGDDGSGTLPPALSTEPPAPKPAEPPKAPLWKAEKYDKVLAQKKELEEKLAALQAAQDPNAPKLTEEDVKTRAAQIAAEAEFNRRANAAADAGKSQFPDFLDKMAKIREQVDQNDPMEQARFVQMVAATLEAGEAAPRILYELGSNPDLATEMMKLSPIQQGMRIARMAEKKPDPEPSNAPRPPSVQVGGRGASQEEITPEDAARADKLSTRTWMERRQKHIEEMKKQGVRIW